VRDNYGDLIMASLVPIHSKSNNITEALASEFGVKWCNQHGYANFILELDSLISANMMTNRMTNNMKNKQIVDNIINEANIGVYHYFREGT